MPKKRQRPRKPIKNALRGHKTAYAHVAAMKHRIDLGAPGTSDRRKALYEALQGYSEVLRMDVATFMVEPSPPRAAVFPHFYGTLEQAVSTNDEYIENLVFQSFFTVLMAWCQGVREAITPAQAADSVQWLEENADIVLTEPALLAWIAHPNGSDTATVKDALDAAGDGSNLLLQMLVLICGAVGSVADGDTEWLRQFDVANLAVNDPSLDPGV
jgi:hypothetical protein